MTDNATREVFKKILTKDFDMSKFDFDTFVGLGSEIIEHRELYQKVLGKFAYSIESNFGDHMMEKFSKALEDTTGYRISPSTLFNYRWIYSKVGNIDMPEDFNFSAWQALASVTDPVEWVRRAQESGWSSSQLRREIKIATGKEPQIRIIKCPKCGEDISIK